MSTRPLTPHSRIQKEMAYRVSLLPGAAHIEMESVFSTECVRWVQLQYPSNQRPEGSLSISYPSNLIVPVPAPWGTGGAFVAGGDMDNGNGTITHYPVWSLSLGYDVVNGTTRFTTLLPFRPLSDGKLESMRICLDYNPGVQDEERMARAYLDKLFHDVTAIVNAPEEIYGMEPEEWPRVACEFQLMGNDGNADARGRWRGYWALEALRNYPDFPPLYFRDKVPGARVHPEGSVPQEPQGCGTKFTVCS